MGSAMTTGYNEGSLFMTSLLKNSKEGENPTTYSIMEENDESKSTLNTYRKQNNYSVEPTPRL